MGGYAWVTLATNDSYSLGALVLAHSLKQAGTTQQLAVLITPGVTDAMREKLSSVFNVVQEVNILDSRDEANLRLLKRPELGITFTKLHCWRLTQFDKCVFLDADTLVLQNCDELFEREELSAAPDVGWPDCFNSGVFVYRPSNDTYESLIQFALDKGSFDGGDQGLLNLYFSDWAHKDISKHLPFIYNMCSTACYSYLPAFKQFGGNAKIIHFIGPAKPWLQYFDSESRIVNPSGGLQHLQHVLQKWWDLFCQFIHPVLSKDMTGLAGAYAQLTLGVARTPEQAALDDHLRRQGWEVGNIDYLGRDSFDNIWNKICQTLGETKIEPVAPVKEVKKTPVTPTKEAPAPVLPAAKPKAPDASPSSDVTATPPDEAVTEQQQQEIQPTTTEIKLTEQPIPTTQIQPPTPTTPVDVPQTNVELTESVPVTTPTEPSSVAIAESVQLTESVPVPTPTESSSVESVQLTESVPVPTPTEPSVAESVQLTESVPVPTPAEPSSVQITDKSDASPTEPLVVKEIDVSPSEAIIETKPDAPPAESVAESVTEPKAEDASAALAEPVCPIVAKAPEASLAPIETPIVPETPVESPAQAQPKKEEPKAQVPSTPPVVAAAPSIPSTPPAEAKPKAEPTAAPTAAPSTAPAAEAATPAPTPPPRKPAAPKKILKPKK